MPKVLDKNTGEIYEVCLHHLSSKHKKPECVECLPDYDLNKRINNYNCSNYHPQIQIDSDRLIKRLSKERKRDLTNKEKEKITLCTGIMNAGLIDCNGHKVNNDEVILSLKEYLKTTTFLS